MGKKVDFCALLGKNVRNIRTSRKLTQNAFAETLNVSVVTISQIENGRIWPKVSFFNTMVEKFDIEPFELFIGTESDLEYLKQIIISTLADQMDSMYPTSHKTKLEFSTTHKRKIF